MFNIIENIIYAKPGNLSLFRIQFIPKSNITRCFVSTSHLMNKMSMLVMYNVLNAIDRCRTCLTEMMISRRDRSNLLNGPSHVQSTYVSIKQFPIAYFKSLAKEIKHTLVIKNSQCKPLDWFLNW